MKKPLMANLQKFVLIRYIFLFCVFDSIYLQFEWAYSNFQNCLTIFFYDTLSFFLLFHTRLAHLYYYFFLSILSINRIQKKMYASCFLLLFFFFVTSLFYVKILIIEFSFSETIECDFWFVIPTASSHSISRYFSIWMVHCLIL